MKAICSIRYKLVSENRWPEMITFEELNEEVPNRAKDNLIAYAVVRLGWIEKYKDGFIK